jgi:hypothetical protein
MAVQVMTLNPPFRSLGRSGPLYLRTQVER